MILPDDSFTITVRAIVFDVDRVILEWNIKELCPRQSCLKSERHTEVFLIVLGQYGVVVSAVTYVRGTESFTLGVGAMGVVCSFANAR